MNEREETPKRESITDALNKYKTNRQNIENEDNVVKNISIPKPSTSNIDENQYNDIMSRETDPDLITSYEILTLPSKGKFYNHGIGEVSVEYLTSKDEDLLTTISLIENGTVLDILLKRKIKTKGIEPSQLLSGDRNAIILFLRTSSYGPDYTVQVTDPRNGNSFKETIDLTKLEYKEVKELPDENGFFNVEIPMRKKLVKFRLLSNGEDDKIYKQAEAIKNEFNREYSEYSTMKLKAQIISIDGKTDRNYINKFVDAMPALDAFTIRKKINEVSPDVDMSYEFTAKDGYTFNANLVVGPDFFFPSI